MTRISRSHAEISKSTNKYLEISENVDYVAIKQVSDMLVNISFTKTGFTLSNKIEEFLIRIDYEK